MGSAKTDYEQRDRRVGSDAIASKGKKFSRENLGIFLPILYVAASTRLYPSFFGN